MHGSMKERCQGQRDDVCGSTSERCCTEGSKDAVLGTTKDRCCTVYSEIMRRAALLRDALLKTARRCAW